MRRRLVYDRWFGRTSVVTAWLVLAVALVHPPHGLGIRLCWLSATTNVPCPGCGLTRALSSAACGLLVESWRYHGLGLPILAMLVVIAGVGLMPKTPRRRLAVTVLRHHRVARAAYVGFVAIFIAHGVVRAVVHLLG